MFRGYLQFTVASGIGFWPAAFGLLRDFWRRASAKFRRRPRGSAGRFLIGLFYCLTLRRTGNLWFAIGSHAAFDFGETYLVFGAQQRPGAAGPSLQRFAARARWLTGGTIGPEGSVFSFVVLAAMFALFARVYPPNPLAPQSSSKVKFATTRTKFLFPTRVSTMLSAPRSSASTSVIHTAPCLTSRSMLPPTNFLDDTRTVVRVASRELASPASASASCSQLELFLAEQRHSMLGSFPMGAWRSLKHAVEIPRRLCARRLRREIWR